MLLTSLSVLSDVLDTPIEPETPFEIIVSFNVSPKSPVFRKKNFKSN